MREQFQAIEWSEPPVGDLVEKAVVQGRRMRAARRARVGGVAGLAVLAVTGASVGLVVHRAGPDAPAPAAVIVAAPSARATSTAPAEKSRVKATPAGLLALLLDTLPEGRTSHYAGLREDDDMILQTFLDRGKGPGVIRVNVINGKGDPDAEWTPLGDGIDYLVQHVPGNCLQETVVVVRHPGNLMVQFNLYACPSLRDVQVRKNVLSVQDAVRAGADPRWGLRIDPAFNKQGATRFPDLSRDFSNG